VSQAARSFVLIHTSILCRGKIGDKSRTPAGRPASSGGVVDDDGIRRL
jgi:hypothetical protein